MKLSEFLSTLNTKDVLATITDYETGEEIVTLKTPGYASLEDTIENRAVRKWEIVSATRINIVLGDTVTTTEPSNP